jgi:hypothetical protein
VFSCEPSGAIRRAPDRHLRAVRGDPYATREARATEHVR